MTTEHDTIAATETSPPAFNPADHRILAILRAGDIVLNHAFTYRGKARHYLRGVHVEPIADGGTLSVATDGWRLGVFHNPFGFVARKITVRLPKRILEEAKNSVNGYLVIFEPELGSEENGQYAQAIFSETDPAEIGQDIRSVVSYRPFFVRLIPTCDFPNWRKAIPAAPKQNIGAPIIDPELLMPFHRISGFVRLLPTDNSKMPAIIIDCGIESFFGILMPATHLINGSKADDPFTMPNWLGLAELVAFDGAENISGETVP